MIRLTNCLQLLSCICDVASIFDENLRHLAHMIHVTAELCFYTIIGCMAAQVNREIDVRKANSSTYYAVPEVLYVEGEEGDPMMKIKEKSLE